MCCFYAIHGINPRPRTLRGLFWLKTGIRGKKLTDRVGQEKQIRTAK